MTKWEIKCDPTESIPVRRGEESVAGLRVRYRPAGSRGRFKSFVLVGPLPHGRTVADVVNEVERKAEVSR